MTKEQKALQFLSTLRGQYIVSQALCLAVKEINKRPKEQQEPSNVADMEYLIDSLFPLYRVMELAKEKFIGEGA